MLGNWSIGHYFKEGAIDYAWEFSTQVLGLDPERLWPSIYPDDAESERLWVEKIGVPRERISRLTENWWAAGPTGPRGGSGLQRRVRERYRSAGRHPAGARSA